MNASPIDIDAVPWKKIGRRWRAVLGAMLFINGVTVVWAVCDKAMTAPAGAAIARAGESPDVVASAEQFATEASVEPAPNGAAQPDMAIDAPSRLVESAQVREESSASAAVAVVLAAEDKRESLDKPAKSNDESNVVAANENAVNKPEVKHGAEIDFTGTLLIINPPTTGGVVHYMIDGKAAELDAP